MLLEAFDHLTTPCAEPWRTMGYLRELIAIDARYRRCHAAWQPHLERTKAAIAAAADAAPAHDKAVVLGAGTLTDIPLSTLAGTFNNVVLLDVCFLRSTRQRARAFGNVHLETADITGAAARLYAWADGGAAASDCPVFGTPDVPHIADADLVISANVLSQLPMIPLDFLIRRAPHLTNEDRSAIARELVQAHLAALDRCMGTVCLITETARDVRDGETTLETEDPLWGVTVAQGQQAWTWDVAPRGEISRDVSIQNKVTARRWTRP